LSQRAAKSTLVSSIQSSIVLGISAHSGPTPAEWKDVLPRFGFEPDRRRLERGRESLRRPLGSRGDPHCDLDPDLPPPSIRVQGPALLLADRRHSNHGCCRAISREARIAAPLGTARRLVHRGSAELQPYREQTPAASAAAFEASAAERMFMFCASAESSRRCHGDRITSCRCPRRRLRVQQARVR
jgi:hypothetical protein